MIIVNVHSSCHYAMLCFALQGAVSELSFMAKPCQPNGYDNQMVLIDPFEGDKSDTPTIYGHPWHGHNHGPAHDHDYNHNHSHESHSLSSHNPDLRPRHFMMWVTPALLSEIARLATIIASSS